MKYRLVKVNYDDIGHTSLCAICAFEKLDINECLKWHKPDHYYVKLCVMPKNIKVV